MNRPKLLDPAGEDDPSPFHLSSEECWRQLRAVRFGRLAVVRPDGHPDIFPVNHHVHGESILVRTGRGSKLSLIIDHPLVAFEADGQDEDFRWSVVVRGSAAQITSEMELQRLGARELVSWTPTPKQFVVRITPESISGRRFDVSSLSMGPVYGIPADPTAPPGASSRADRPTPIPHFEPPSVAPDADDPR